MSKTVEFYYDVGSPAAYLAWTQLPALVARHGGDLVYMPMLLGGVFKIVGNRSPIEIPAKGRWLNTDLARFATRYGVTFNLNPYFPINTLHLMRGATAALEDGRIEDYNAAVFEAIWVNEKNMNDPSVVADVLSTAGFDPETVMQRIADDSVKQRLKSVTEDAVGRGVFGAPTMFIDGEMFFGQDRLDFVTERLAA